MQAIDKIVFGDNQFFGINHMSQEKAQQLAEKFFDVNNIYRVYGLMQVSGCDVATESQAYLNISDKTVVSTKILIGILLYLIHRSMPIW